MEVVIKKSIIYFIALVVVLFIPHHFDILAAESLDKAVSKKILENGLTILAKERAPKDLVAIDIKIRAGSSLEGEYLGSGISHFLEHMIFKGTPTRGVGQIESQIKSYGGFINGSVSQDLTDFNVTVPPAHLAETLALLKDMLLNAEIDNAELEKERQVVLKELRLDNDEPQNRIIRLLNQTAYIRHPYKYPPIGYENRFNALTRDDLLKYYNRMYAPNRMVISIVGGVAADDAISKVENEFKNFRQPNYNDVWDTNPAEGAQIDRRTLTEEADINLSYLAMGFHSTSVLNTDLFAMDVVSMILGRGDNSRLNMSLFKKKGIAHTISSWNYTPRDAGLFTIMAIADADKVEGCEVAAMEEIDKIRSDLVGDDELETAKRMVISDFIFLLETIEAQATDMSSNYILTGSYDFSSRYVEGVKAVSKDDIKRVANIYLRPDNLTVIKLIPRGSRKAEPKTEKVIAKDEIEKVELANGLRLLLREDKKTPTISVSVVMLGGLMVEGPSNNGISNLTAMMLLKGTRTAGEGEIKGRIEKLGGDINAFSGANSFGLNLELLKEDFDVDIGILKDVLTNSIFPQDQIDKQKTLILAKMKDEDDDIFQRGLNLLREELFKGSVYAFRYIGSEESVKSLKREDLLNFYGTYCVPNNMVISVSGDIERGAVRDKLKTVFGDLKTKTVSIPSPEVADIVKPETRSLEMPKEESLVLQGFKTVSAKNPDRYALDVLCSIMSGTSGRLFASLRDKQSLAYTLGCVQKSGFDTGYLIFYVATVKEKIAQVKGALMEQIKKISQGDVDDKELALAKRELTTRYAIGSQTNGFFSQISAMDELYGVGYDTLYRYTAEIDRVTATDIKRIANKYLDIKACREVTISPK